jgi:hypothetical protein
MFLRSLHTAKVAESIDRAGYPEEEMKLIPDRITKAAMAVTFVIVCLVVWRVVFNWQY